MNAQKAPLTLQKVSEMVYKEITNPEKDGYDLEVQLPKTINKKDYIKKTYNSNAETDTPQNRKRRQNRASKTEQYIKDGKIAEAKKNIKAQYYITIKELVEKGQIILGESTARKLIKALNKIIGYSEETKIPEAMANEYADNINKWIKRTKVAYACAENTSSAIKLMEKTDMVNLYQLYLLMKRIILFDCKDNQEYERRVSAMLQNEQVKAVCEATKIIAPYLI